jgi:hypothetical protein
MPNVFGFCTAPSAGGDFTPILKYDARAGRIFRMERVETDNGFESKAVDITDGFKAIFDFEHVEVGWIHFLAGSAPDFKLVPIGNELPDKPSASHKNGIRSMMKLAKDCAGGSAAVREIAGTSKAFLAGVEALYIGCEANAAANPGKLPVVVLDKVTTVKTGTGAKSSTNFQPVFRIVGWVARGDFVFVPKSMQLGQAASQPIPQVATPPTTGSIRAQAPSQENPTDEDFG